MGPIVCCVDDSDGARRALTLAHQLAGKLGAELVLAHVEPPTAVPGVSAAPAGRRRLREEELRDANALLARIASEVGLPDGHRSHVVIGGAADGIVAICEEEGAGMVVIGSRGRGDITSALLGSVSSAVAAKVSCPCLIVPPTAHLPTLD
jgi:nucleotide-binding universal stress UspA family protein